MDQASVQERTAQDEGELLDRLRAGDERAFEALVARYYPTMLAVALHHVRTRAVAEEVVQEAWLGVLKGLDRFEGRSSLKTWILRILVNTAKTRGVREARTVPYSSLAPEGEEPAVEPERFRGPGDPFPGHWRAYPGDWQRLPDEALAQGETLKVVLGAIEALPPRAAHGDRAARHPGLRLRGGVRAAGGLGGQPARAPAPGPLEGAGRAGEAPRWLST